MYELPFFNAPMGGGLIIEIQKDFKNLRIVKIRVRYNL